MSPSPLPAPRTPWIPGAGEAALAGLAALVMHHPVERRTHVEAGCVVVLTALLLGGVVLTLRRRDRPGEACALALGFVPAALPLWLATRAAEIQSLTVDHTVDNLVPGFFFLLVVPALLFFTVHAGRAAGWAIAARAGDRAAVTVRASAWAAALGALALVAAWTARSRLPTATAYLRALPVVASFDEWDRSRYAAPFDSGGGNRVRRMARKGGCWIGGLDEAPPADGLLPGHRYWDVHTCGPTLVRADERRGLLVLEDEHGRRIALDRARGWMPVPLPPVRLAGSVRPPDAFGALALLGLAGALVALLWPRRSRLPADESACREAEVLTDGMLRFTDETPPLPLPASAPAVVGRVVAVLGTPAESFRDHAGPIVVRAVPGTLTEHRFAARLGRAPFALAFVVIGCTPLLTALLYLR